MLSSAVIVGLTLWLVAGCRKLVKAIDGKLLVLACGTLVGTGLSFLAGIIDASIAGVPMLAWWILLARGTGAAAVAFGYANYKQWVISQMPVLPVPAAHVTIGPPKDKPTEKPKPAAVTAALLLCTVLCCAVPTTGCAAAMPIIGDVIAAAVDAIPIIEDIADFIDRHFQKHEDAAKEEEVRDALSNCREAFVVSERSAMEATTAEEADAAWEPFRASYKALKSTIAKTPGVEVIAPEKGVGEPSPRSLMVSRKTGAELLLRDPLVVGP